MAIIDNVETIILLMFENRSFDHMLGHLSLESINRNVDGYKQPLSQYNNFYQGDAYPIYNFRNDQQLPFDLPHEFDYVNMQLAKSGVSGRLTMTGFVEAYAKFLADNPKTGHAIPNPQAEPMGYFNSAEVPITSFLARVFCTCDKWFCPLPTGTQPNRTMAFSGDSPIFKNGFPLHISNNNIFDWMENQVPKVRWRVYHDGLSFFALYPSLWNYVLSDHFRDYEFLARDILNEPADKAPQVIIIEPSYQDAPHVGPDRPNDNHPPLAIGWGEEFLRRTYEGVIANTQKWKKTVMVVYYDEHGGFYDHVSPLPVNYRGIPEHPFESLGPRIPGIILSPFVQQASVCNSLLDHTSVLQFLAEKFSPGTPYCPTVQNRKTQGIMSISAALTNPNSWDPPPPPSQPIHVASALGTSIAVAPTEENPKAFEQAALDLIQQRRAGVDEYYPELLQWKQSVENART